MSEVARNVLTVAMGGVVGSTRIAGILVEVVTDEKVLRIPLRKQERESGKKPYERHSPSRLSRVLRTSAFGHRTKPLAR
jgi:hypothetical protein